MISEFKYFFFLFGNHVLNSCFNGDNVTFTKMRNGALLTYYGMIWCVLYLLMWWLVYFFVGTLL